MSDVAENIDEFCCVYSRLIAEYQRNTPRWQLWLLARVNRRIVVGLVIADNRIQETDLYFELFLWVVVGLLWGFWFAFQYIHPAPIVVTFTVAGILHMAYTVARVMMAIWRDNGFTDTLLPQSTDNAR